MRSKIKKAGVDFHVLSLKVLEYANLEKNISDFIRKCAGILCEITGNELTGIYITDNRMYCYGEYLRGTTEYFNFETLNPSGEIAVKSDSTAIKSGILKLALKIIEAGQTGRLPIFINKNGSIIARNPDDIISHLDEPVNKLVSLLADYPVKYKSIVVIPIRVADKMIGYLIMASQKDNFCQEEDVEYCEGISDTLGIALVNHRTQTALRERVKELTCLYRIAQIAAEPGLSLDEVISKIVCLLPPAWQFPEITEGRIILDGQVYTTPDFQEACQSQTATIRIGGVNRGNIEVAYSTMMPELDEGPFLNEERKLIDAVARLVAQIIERKQAEEDRLRLQDQLRHADRLATIGQLAAGVAHEFNEPLGNILGFAQLILKSDSLSGETRSDTDKIVTASMHAREVVRKLMLFARQLPSKRSHVNLNNVVRDGLYFLEARCTRAGIDMVRNYSPDLPEITADQAQMHQVLVNLVVNAIQAMPDGGTITISTDRRGRYVSLRVDDTGLGMSDEIKNKLFIPFFTTKDVDEGTGLGLPVVHGIVSSHGGTINVESEPGVGSSFEILLPIESPADSGEIIR